MDIISLLNLNTHNQSFLFVIYSFSLFLNQSQQMGRHLKVHHDGADVHNRCDQRRRHNSRIHVKLLGKQRKHASDHFGDQNSGYQGDGYKKRQHWVPITNHHVYTIDNSQCGAHQNRHPEFLENNPEDIPKMDFIQRQSPDNQRRTLGTAVSACIRQHRNEGNKERNRGKRSLIVCNNRLGECGG